jgi:protein O-mannosyl-transferase
LRLLGVAYGVQGRNDLAVNYFTKALNIQPENAEALWNLANAYFYIGNEAKALEFRQKALQIDPEIANRRNK